VNLLSREPRSLGHARRCQRPCAAASVLSLVALAACIPSAVSEGGSATPARGHGGRGVLVIVVDALRLDHMGFAGYDRATTPVIDGLIAQGAAMTQTFSAAPEFIPSHAGLLTGCDPVIARQPLPPDPGVPSIGRRWRLPSAAPALAAEFLAAGYATLALSDHPRMAREYGFGRGFERFDDFQGGQLIDQADFGAAELGRALVDWIRSLEQDRDWFAYVDVNDLERAVRYSEENWDTYFQPRPELDEIPPVSEVQRCFFAIASRLWPGEQRTVGEYEACYDGFVRRLDVKIGRLIGVLDRIGQLEQTTLCIIGSYGIGFGEAGLYLDHGALADVDLAVPWVLRYPASCELPRGRRCDGVASTIDLAPTLLELAGLPVPPGMHGKSHLPALRSPDAAPIHDFVFSSGGLCDGFAVHDQRFSYQATVHATRGDPDLVASWYGAPKPLKRSRRRFLRDRSSDPDPGDRGRAAVEPAVAERLQAAGDDWFTWIDLARLALHDPPWVREELTPEVREELRRRGLVPGPRER
jgi:arylsulfatase